MFTRILIYHFIIFSLGCSTATVHLHVSGVEHEELNKISISLKEQGLKVRIRDNKTPAALTDTTIMYSPYDGFDSDLKKIKMGLEHQNFTVGSIIIGGYGNHEYTQKNIGLYLVSTQESVLIRSNWTTSFQIKKNS